MGTGIEVAHIGRKNSQSASFRARIEMLDVEDLRDAPLHRQRQTDMDSFGSCRSEIGSPDSTDESKESPLRVF